VDTNELRRLAAEVDDEHCAAMRELSDRLAAEVVDAGPAASPSRRSFLRRLGLSGAAIGTGAIALPVMARAAAAQATTTTTIGTEPVGAFPTTTVVAAGATTTVAPGPITIAPPKKPTPEDVAVFSFAQSLELALVQAYEAVVGTGILAADVQTLAAEFASHHSQHGQAFAGLAGKAGTATANQSILAKFGPLVASAKTQVELLTLLFDLENTTASTYTAALDQLTGTDGAAVVASIQPIESRHALVLGQVAELDPSKYLIPFLKPDDAVTPADYPIIAR
jgi:hypothetical protein